MQNAGGEWLDEEVVVDGNLVHEPVPEGHPGFQREAVELIERAPVGGSR